jgi:hypothetical protein
MTIDGQNYQLAKNGVDMKKMSTGDDATLGNYRKMASAVLQQ